MAAVTESVLLALLGSAGALLVARAGIPLLHAFVIPESVDLTLKGRVLAFIGLERTLAAAFAVYDVTNPHEAELVDMIVSEGDVSTEGLTAFRVGGRYFVATANEISDSTLLFEVTVRRGQSDDE